MYDGGSLFVECQCMDALGPTVLHLLQAYPIATHTSFPPPAYIISYCSTVLHSFPTRSQTSLQYSCRALLVYSRRRTHRANCLLSMFRFMFSSINSFPLYVRRLLLILYQYQSGGNGPKAGVKAQPGSRKQVRKGQDVERYTGRQERHNCSRYCAAVQT